VRGWLPRAEKLAGNPSANANAQPASRGESDLGRSETPHSSFGPSAIENNDKGCGNSSEFIAFKVFAQPPSLSALLSSRGRAGG